jgi:hypothetical protein
MFAARDMPYYRVYTLTDDGHILGPPHVFDCPNDEDATQKAVQLINGRDVELWEGARFVTRIRSTAGQ